MPPKPALKQEEIQLKKGYGCIIGVDEVGRGSLAGPLVAGAVAIAKKTLIHKNFLLKINDSKLLTPSTRKLLYKEIKKYLPFWSVSEISVNTIDKFGVSKATKMAFRKAVLNIINKALGKRRIVSNKKFFVLIDAFHVKYLKGIGLKNQKAIIKGDQKCVSIAAASIVAKVYRDNLMTKLAKKYPKYHFERNKGYGTKLHKEALKKYGPSKIHRRSFKF